MMVIHSLIPYQGDSPSSKMECNMFFHRKSGIFVRVNNSRVYDVFL